MQAVPVSSVSCDTDHDYATLEDLIRQRVHDFTGVAFTTSAEGLFKRFLDGLPQNRQHYNCHCCRRFIERYGGLVTLSTEGEMKSLLFDDKGVPEFFRRSVDSLRSEVLLSRVDGVFINGETVWGTPQTRSWTHLSGRPQVIYHNLLKTADQLMAEKKEDYKMVSQALPEYSVEVLKQAVRILSSDTLYRSEKASAIADWFLKLHQNVTIYRQQRARIVWLAVATAPVGFCHIRSTVISTLLDDIKNGLDIDSIKRRWAEKLHPLQYQRPTTIKEGNLDRANEIIAKLGSAGLLARRFAKLEDVTFTHWKPREVEVAPQVICEGPFDYLKVHQPKVSDIELPAKLMTWEKFRDTILPTALEIWFGGSASRIGFGALVTGEPGLFQWDNAVSSYVYNGGSYSSDWNLGTNRRIRVTAITRNPTHWTDATKYAHQGQSAFFILENAKDLKYAVGGGWFPECLKSDYHEIRGAMEAYAKTAVIADAEGMTAAGLFLSPGVFPVPVTFRVRSADGFANYTLDRWE